MSQLGWSGVTPRKSRHNKAHSQSFAVQTFTREFPSVSWETAFLSFNFLTRGHVNMEADFVVWTLISQRLSFRCVRRYEPCPCQLESKMPDLPVRCKTSFVRAWRKSWKKDSSLWGRPHPRLSLLTMTNSVKRDVKKMGEKRTFAKFLQKYASKMSRNATCPRPGPVLD